MVLVSVGSISSVYHTWVKVHIRQQKYVHKCIRQSHVEIKEYSVAYFDFIIYLTHANVWESMGKPCNCTQFTVFFYYKSHENPYWYYKLQSLHLDIQ